MIRTKLTEEQHIKIVMMPTFSGVNSIIYMLVGKIEFYGKFKFFGRANTNSIELQRVYVVRFNHCTGVE